jgi:hypothetical protein
MDSFVPEDMKDSKIVKVLLFIPLAITFILLLPLAIVAAPFYAAAQCVKELTTTKKKSSALTAFDFGGDQEHKINELILDFNNWFNTGEEF